MLNCSKCKKDLPESEYYNSKNKRKFSYVCKSCKKEYDKTQPSQYIAKVLKCTHCHHTRPTTDFPGRGLAGHLVCTPCLKTKGKAYCSHCHKILPVDQFFKNAAMKSGLNNNCKICFTGLEREHRHRGGNAHKAQRIRDRKNDPVTGEAYREVVRQRQRNYRLHHWLETKARWWISKLINDLHVMARPDHCEYCKKPAAEVGPLESHHFAGYLPQVWGLVDHICHTCHQATRQPGYVERTHTYINLDQKL